MHDRYHETEGWGKCEYCPVTSNERCSACFKRVCPDCRDYHEDIMCSTDDCPNDIEGGDGYDGYCADCSDKRETAGLYR